MRHGGDWGEYGIYGGRNPVKPVFNERKMAISEKFPVFSKPPPVSSRILQFL
jgi:hypothetical protein